MRSIKDSKSEDNYRCDDYYNQVLVKEQPFYRAGMGEKEAEQELKYLNDNLDAFYAGTYIPLWKQNLYR